MRTWEEHDTKIRFRISLLSFEKIDSQIPEFKKTDLRLKNESFEISRKSAYICDVRGNRRNR